MALTEDREKRRQGFLDWDVEHELPEAVGDFHFRRLDRQEGRIYYAFSYVSDSTGWEVRALFDEETMDYMVKTDFRLFTLTDIDMVTGSFDQYKRAVRELLAKNMRRELLERETISVLVRGRAFTKWDASDVFPEEIGHYKRLADPTRPILGLNGSYIIGMYEWREGHRGMLFFYNMYRDIYYAEMNAETIPVIIHDYDAESAEKLEGCIRKYMKRDLARLDTLEPES